MDEINTTLKAEIQWLDQRKPPKGIRYSTVARFKNQKNWTEEAWSVILEFENTQEKLVFEAAISLLFPENCKHNFIFSGNEFELYEGKKLVAKGVIL